MIASMRAPVTVVRWPSTTREYVRACFDSAMRRRRSPERVLVIDDCSQDGTADAVAAYVADLPQALARPVALRAHSENIGLCRSLNEALARGHERVHAYISADDVMEPSTIPGAAPADSSRNGRRVVRGRLLGCAAHR